MANAHPALADHPELARSRLVHKRIVIAISGLSAATIERRVKDGSIPAPVKISKNRVAWRETEIQEWLDDPKGWIERNA